MTIKVKTAKLHIWRDPVLTEKLEFKYTSWDYWWLIIPKIHIVIHFERLPF